MLDVADDRLGLGLPPVDEQPAGALRHMPPDGQDGDGQDHAEGEADPPADVLRQPGGVQQGDRSRRPGGRTDPVRAVDDKVNPAPGAGRDQLVDGRVDRRVLTADPGPGEEPSGEEEPRAERRPGGRRGHQVQAKRPQEQLLPAEPVGELAEEQRAQAGAGHVDGPGGPDLRGADGDPAAGLGHPGGDRAHDRHLEPVKDPRGAQAEDDQPVEPRPRQPVEPGGNLGPDDAGLDGRAAHQPASALAPVHSIALMRASCRRQGKVYRTTIYFA